MYKKILLFSILLFNASYGMENEISEKKQSPLAIEIARFNNLLNDDLTTTSTSIETLATGWPDSKKCTFGALAGVGMCALSCLASDEMRGKIFGMGATLFLGNGVLTLATTHHENNKKTFYTGDQQQLNSSIEALKQTLSKVLHEANASGDFNQTLNTSTVSTQQQIDDKNVLLIHTCNDQYDRDINLIKKLTAEYPTSRVCFYSTLIGMLLCSIAWLNKNNKDAAQLAGMGSILFFGAGVIGLVSAKSEDKNLDLYIKNKATSRQSLMQINRS